MIPGQANFLQSLGWAVFNSLWQMALLWVIYHTINGIAKSTKSSFRSSLASILLITGFVWFVYTFYSFYRNDASGQAVLTFSILNPAENQQVTNWLQQALPFISVFYLVLLIIPISHFIRNYRYVRIIRQYGLSKMNVQWRIFVKKVATRMGIKKHVQIWLSEFVSSPVTIGFLKPVILFPLAAINHLSPGQIEAVLLHELAHIRRYDYLINLIINFIKTILYFNPFVKAFVKIVEKEREKSSDEMVLQFQYDSYEYATALLALEKTNQEYRLLPVGATGKKNDLLERVELIMGIKTKSVFSFNKLAGIVAGLICIFAMNAFLKISKSPERKSTGIIANISTPFNFFTKNISESSENPDPKEKVKPVITKNNLEAVTQVDDALPENIILPPPPDPAVLNVSYKTTEALQLRKYEEAQVKAAMDASKKVMENEEWKALEKNIADVFTQKEKAELKATYLKELDKMDWNKWENNLRLVYNKVDWNRVNEQLETAINNIRVDSLQKVYTEAISKLDDVKKGLQINLKDLSERNMSAEVLDQKKQELQNVLNKLKARKAGKIVHL